MLFVFIHFLYILRSSLEPDSKCFFSLLSDLAHEMSCRIHDRAKIQARDLREGRSTAEDDVRNVPGRAGSWMKGVFSVRIIEMD